MNPFVEMQSYDIEKGVDGRLQAVDWKRHMCFMTSERSCVFVEDGVVMTGLPLLKAAGGPTVSGIEPVVSSEVVRILQDRSRN